MKKKKYASFNVMRELAYFHYLVQGFANPQGFTLTGRFPGDLHGS